MRYRTRVMLGLFFLGVAVGGVLRGEFSLSFGWHELATCTLVSVGLAFIFLRVPK